VLLQLSAEDENRVFGDFVWAMETLPETRSLAATVLRPGGLPIEDISEVIRRRISGPFNTGRSLDSPPLDTFDVTLDPSYLRSDQLYVAYLRWLDVYGMAGWVSLDPYFWTEIEAMFAADGSPTAPGYLDTITYRLMLTSFVGTALAVPQARSLLRLLLLRGSLNRQLAIMHFIHLLRQDLDEAGPTEFRTPTKESVLAEVREWESALPLVNFEFGLGLLNEYRNRWGQPVGSPVLV
jgi:hypothetical protein